MTETRLAVGIPTRNRAALAITAIESVLRSAPPGVRLVVSDNSTEPREAESLRDHCERLPPGRAVYVRPPEPLRMTDHWEWLLRAVEEHADPTHVTYLTDRMAFTSGSLEQLTEIVGRDRDAVVSYQWDHLRDDTRPVELAQSQWTGRLLELDCSRLLDLASRGGFGNHLPRLMTCVAPMSVANDIAARFGDVFGDVSPDYRFAFRCLALRESILYLDRPCLVEYGLSRSAGASYIRGESNDDAARFDRELAVRRFGATPEPEFETAANALFQEYCAVRAELGDDRLPPADRRAYLAAHAVSASRMSDRDRRERVEALLRKHRWTRAQRARYALEQAVAMGGYFARHPAALARSARRQLWERPPATPLANLLERVGVDPRIRGELRFESPAEGLAHAVSHPRRPTPHAWHVHQLSRAGAIVGRR